MRKLLLAAAAVAVSVATASANLLLNPGFATQGAGPYNAAVWQDQDDPGSSLASGRESWGSQDGDGYLEAIYGWVTPGSQPGRFYQDVGVTPGWSYYLNFWHEGDSGWNGSNERVRIIWLDSGLSPVGTPVVVDVSSHRLVGSWAQFGATGALAPAGSAYARIQAEANTAGAGAQKFDNFNFDVEVIPEPSVAGLLAVGFGALRILRKRA